MVNISESEAQEARTKQSQGAKKATLAKLKGKKLATHDFTVVIGGEELEISYKAISHGDYDKLISKYPPTKEQQADGAVYNINRFGPALISAVIVEPKMSQDDAQELWDSPDWSRGDLMTLFAKAVNLCNDGFDVPSSGRG